MKIYKDFLITIDKKHRVFLNFNKPVGRVLLKKIIEIQQLIEKDEIDKDLEPKKETSYDSSLDGNEVKENTNPKLKGGGE